MSDRIGHCLCGAVALRIVDFPREFGACHCEMCRRWTGSAFLAATVPPERVQVIAGADHVARYQSSGWAERAWCSRCGSNLWYRLVGPRGAYEIPIGLLDDPDGLVFSSEIYIDCRPDSFAFEGTAARETMTRAACFEKFAPSTEE
ncbi:aldehyde-activating protein [Rhodobacteraceae bacterium WD3A24]|nr:aldehyde-activating protein [Rhodobacteraceae bacterium WD3A24]